VAATDPLASIVVGVDRTGSGAAVDLGAAEALRTGRPLELVHVAPPVDGWLATVGRDALSLAGSRASTQLQGRVAVCSDLVRGDVVEELVSVGARCALTVLEQVPPRQQRRRTHLVTAALAARLDVPLVVVPASWVGRRRALVTVGFDPLAPDDVALRAAVVQARLRDATIRVVVAGPRGEVDARLVDAGADACDVAVEESIGDAAALLRQAALTSDLVVIGRRLPTLSSPSRVGPVARALLQDPPCPLLLTMPGHDGGGARHVPHLESRVG
jgi:nucleotide-binding universal stress UspA family protein